MSEADWQTADWRALGVELDERLLLLLNASPIDIVFTLPSPANWRAVLDTADPQGRAVSASLEAVRTVLARSAVVLLRPQTERSPG
jgi:pullulanase/glycogen debranching enzyme